MSHRFARTELVVGPEGLSVLQRATIAVIGLGGVGSYTVEALARSGVGTLVLMDKDVVDITNINRQLPALESTIGQSKVEVMSQRVRQINPDCRVETRSTFFRRETADELFRMPLDYVADAIDTVSAKIQLAVACKERGVPLASSMGAANKVDPTQFHVMDISETQTDPIARVMRRELRKHGIVDGLPVVCSRERPRKPRQDVLARLSPPTETGHPLPRKAQYPPASIAFVPPVAGLILASIVIRDLCHL